MFASLHTASFATRRVQSRGILDRLFDLVQSASILSRQRRALAAMDDYRLHDLGLTRAEAQAEATRPLWDTAALHRR
jgi:uncharacterized protein YjiS (DUF1127 family)